MIDRIMTAFQEERGYVQLDEIPGWLFDHGYTVTLQIDADEWVAILPTEYDRIKFLLRWS
jgi:hypothetical protein